MFEKSMTTKIKKKDERRDIFELELERFYCFIILLGRQVFGI